MPQRAKQDLVLGYDLGTSSVKAALFDAEGRVVARARATHPLLLPAPGWAEQRPADWWMALRAVTATLLATSGVTASRIAAIGITAQMCGVVPVDRDGTPVHNALIWLDTRSEAIARRLAGGWITIDGYGPLALWRWLRPTGGAPNLSGRDPLSKMLWLREMAPEAWARTHKLLDVKDWVVHRCTGQFVTSPDCAHLTWLFDARAGRQGWSESLLRHVGLDRTLLPEVRRATEVAGELTAEAAAALGLVAGTPVAAGLGDVSSAAVAAGTLAPGAMHLCVGTSVWLAAHLPTAKVDPFARVGTISAADGDGHLLIATQENAGAAVQWAAPALGFGDGSNLAGFEAAAARSEPVGDAPFFLPWLYGERVPIDDPHVRGGFAGLSIAHGQDDLARAVYEGVALNLRWAMAPADRLAVAAGTPLRFLGGGAQSGYWGQLFADVLERPIERMEAPELGSARGAAMVAAAAAGWYAGLGATMGMARVERCFEPDRRLAGLYAERFARFTALYRRLKPWYRRLAAGAVHGESRNDAGRVQQGVH